MEIELQDEQIEAYEKIKIWVNKPSTQLYTEDDILNNIYGVFASGGTGKTFIISKILKDLDVKGVVYSSSTHQAANVLSRNIKGNGNTRAKTLQSVLGLNISPLAYEALQSVFVAPTMNKVKELMLDSKFTLPDFLVIDEASMIEHKNDLVKREYDEYDEIMGCHVSTIKYVNPDLGTYLIELMKLKYRLFKKETKVFLMGDLVQVAPVGSEPFCISQLLTKIIDIGNYASLHKIRRTNNEVVKEISLELRDIFDKIYKQNDIEVNLLEPFYNRNSSADGIRKTDNKQHLFDTFVKVYHMNIKDKVNGNNPNETVIINYNRIGHTNTINDLNLIRKKLFNVDPSVEMCDGELILNESPIEIKDKNLEDITLDPDTKMIVISHKILKKQITVVLNPRSIKNRKEIIFNNIPLIEAEVSVENPLTGELMIKTLLFKTKELKQLISDGFKTIKKERYITFCGNKNINGKVLFEFNNMLPGFSYAYIVNIFKVQGSTINYPMIDLENIMRSPSDNLHKTSYIYTALSRTKIKPLVYHPNF
jgi:hypothetical protein